MKRSYAVAVLAACVLCAEMESRADENPWPAERIASALQSLDKQRADGLITEAQLQKKREMLVQRRAGKFQATALSDKNPELNLIQNGGFEEINKNSETKRSRWLWWGGWDWGGDYENFWATEKENVHSGKFSAGIRCTGKSGRIGISTPRLPIAGATEYSLTIWAKGEGENELFINFEDGAEGSDRQKIPPRWTEIRVTGKPEKGAKEFTLYLYVTGQGTIYLDDAKLVPAGGNLDEN